MLLSVLPVDGYKASFIKGAMNARLGNTGNNPGRPSRPSFDLHGERNECCSGSWYLLQVGHVLQAINVRTVDDLVSYEVLRRTVIQARRVDPNATDLAPCH